MFTHEFTRDQALAVVRHMIVDWHETQPNMDNATYNSEVIQLARRISTTIEADVKWTEVDEALDQLDQLADIDRNMHPMIVTNRARTIDNRNELTYAFTECLADAIRNVVDTSNFHATTYGYQNLRSAA